MQKLGLGILLVLGLTACGGGATEPQVQAPVISVAGVEDGGIYSGAVTITISVDRGTYLATLDGAAFVSGTTVSAAGAHTLVVNARNGDATSSTTIDFSITVPGGRLLIVRMLDLGANDAGGGGDAILITDSSAAGMRHGLIDAGPGPGGSVTYVRGQLQALGVAALEFVLLTHAHSDHYEGLGPVLNAMDVERFVYNGQQRNLSSYQAVLSTAATRADSLIIPEAPRLLRLASDGAGAAITFLPPLPHYLANPSATGDELNEGSIGAQLVMGAFEMFFTGDGEYEANARWRTTFASYTADVDALKVGHHGANNAIFDTGTTGPSTWLSHTNPEIALISANGITHPRERALNLLLSRSNLRTYCTNVHGRIEIRVDVSGGYTVAVERNPNAVCVKGSEATT